MQPRSTPRQCQVYYTLFSVYRLESAHETRERSRIVSVNYLTNINALLYPKSVWNKKLFINDEAEWCIHGIAVCRLMKHFSSLSNAGYSEWHSLLKYPLSLSTLQVWKTIFVDLIWGESYTPYWGAILQFEHSGHINSVIYLRSGQGIQSTSNRFPLTSHTYHMIHSSTNSHIGWLYQRICLYR